MAVNEDWIKRIFKRFDEIYGHRAESIDKTLENWVFSLEGITAEQIKSALEECKKDISILPTVKLFLELCTLKQSEANSKATTASITSDIRSASIVPFQWPSKSSESPKIVSNQQPEDWKQKLIDMDELTALAVLSNEQRYDRLRLLLEKQGREQVSRLQTIASNKPEIKRKDWN